LAPTKKPSSKIVNSVSIFKRSTKKVYVLNCLFFKKTTLINKKLVELVLSIVSIPSGLLTARVEAVGWAWEVGFHRALESSWPWRRVTEEAQAREGQRTRWLRSSVAEEEPGAIAAAWPLYIHTYILNVLVDMPISLVVVLI
jgi:hypothetical protein